jgi:hypothetical protein
MLSNLAGAGQRNLSISLTTLAQRLPGPYQNLTNGDQMMLI